MGRIGDLNSHLLPYYPPYSQNVKWVNFNNHFKVIWQVYFWIRLRLNKIDFILVLGFFLAGSFSSGTFSIAKRFLRKLPATWDFKSCCFLFREIFSFLFRYFMLMKRSLRFAGSAASALTFSEGFCRKTRAAIVRKFVSCCFQCINQWKRLLLHWTPRL